MHTDTDRMKWLNYFVQNDDHIVLEEEDGGVIMTIAIRDKVYMLDGSSIEDVFDQAMAEFPMPAV